MDVFTSNLAFALDAALEVPVFAQGDERIVDAPRCMVISVEDQAHLKCVVMSTDGMSEAMVIARDIAGELMFTTVDVHPNLKIERFELEGFLTAIEGDAPYAEGLQMTLAFDLKVSAPTAA